MELRRTSSPLDRSDSIQGIHLLIWSDKKNNPVTYLHVRRTMHLLHQNVMPQTLRGWDLQESLSAFSPRLHWSEECILLHQSSSSVRIEFHGEVDTQSGMRNISSER